MKKKIVGIFLTLVLIASFSVVASADVENIVGPLRTSITINLETE